jgi:hypothetical protein
MGNGAMAKGPQATAQEPWSDCGRWRDGGIVTPNDSASESEAKLEAERLTRKLWAIPSPTTDRLRQDAPTCKA